MSLYPRSLIFLLVILRSTLNAQYYEIKNYTSDNGLLSNQTYRLYQDTKNILWIANGRGISAYDGKTFRNYSLNNAFYLNGNFIEDSSGITLSTNIGPASCDYYQLKSIAIPENLLKTFDSNIQTYRMNRAVTDSFGNMIVTIPKRFSVGSDTIFHVNKKGEITPVKFQLNPADTFRLDIHADNFNRVWISVINSRGKLSLYYLNDQKIIKYAQSIPRLYFNSIFRSKSQEIYLVNSERLTKVRHDGNIETITISDKYTSFNIPRLAEDSKGNIWTGYFKGLIKINSQGVTYIENKNRNIEAKKIERYNEFGERVLVESYNDFVYRHLIAVDREDRIISFNEIYDNDEFHPIEIPNEKIYSDVMVDRENQIWYASAKGLFVAKRLNLKKLDLKGVIVYVSPDGANIVTKKTTKDYFEKAFLYLNRTIKDSIVFPPKDYSNWSQIAVTGNSLVLIFCDQIFTIDKERFSRINIKIPANVIPITTNRNERHWDGSIKSSNRQIVPRFIGTDKENNLWGILAGSALFKIKNSEVHYFGQESGIRGVIKQPEDYAPGANHFFTSEGVFIFENGGFTLLKGSEKYLAAKRLEHLGEIGSDSYYILHLSEKKNDFLFVAINKKEIINYKIINTNNLPLEEIRLVSKFHNSFIFHNANGFIKFELNLTKKEVEIKQIVSPLEKVPSAVLFKCLNDKLFAFTEGPIQIYSTKHLEKDTLAPVISYNGFINYLDYVVSDTLGRIYSTGAYGESIEIDSKKSFFSTYIPQTYIMDISYLDTLKPLSGKIPLKLPYYFNPLIIKYKSVCLTEGEKLQYRYQLLGIDKNSSLTKEDQVSYSSLPPGTYTFQIQACNNDGLWNDAPTFLVFTVLPPLYRTWWAYASYVFVAILIIAGIVKVNGRRLRARANLLKLEVEKATFAIREQKHIIEEKHREITDSINYAERIQRSFLATKELLDTNLNQNNPANDNYFVLFKPKDVVSGDFFWAANSHQHFYFCTADSTGHGVPGAIMSLLNITSLEKALEHHSDPADILNHTRNTIIDRLKKDGSEHGGKDGMDCSLLCFDANKELVTTASANNPVWIVRSKHDPKINPPVKELIEIKSDKMPVGKHDRESEPFSSHKISLQSGDVIYTLTDGFPDQFGGDKGKKFMSKKLRELLLLNSHLPMRQQKEILETTFIKWAGGHEQIDDVTVVGIRI
jgi:serine phosphatase RsbU (regulator of sigma subunit)